MEISQTPTNLEFFVVDTTLKYYVFILLLFTPLEFFTSAFAGGLSLEFEWQQASSSTQDSSQYSGRSL